MSIKFLIKNVMYAQKNYVNNKYICVIKRNILAFFISLIFSIINLKNKFNEKRSK